MADDLKQKRIKSAIIDFLDDDTSSPRLRKQKKQRIVPEAFPDYSKSLVTQYRGDPRASGVAKGLTYGTLGAILGALTGRLTDQDINKTLLLSVLGGMLAGTAGYQSGKRQRESDNTRLYFLRRMGIDNPGELEAVSEYPVLAKKLTDEGISI